MLSSFTIDGSDYLTFTGPANYESAKTSYDVDVIATDEDGAKDTVSLTIPVVDVNEAPELTDNPSYYMRKTVTNVQIDALCHLLTQILI